MLNENSDAIDKLRLMVSNGKFIIELNKCSENCSSPYVRAVKATRKARNMKIVLASRSVYPFHGYGGMEKYVYNFARYLVRDGNDVTIIASISNNWRGNHCVDGIKYCLIPPNFKKFRKSSALFLTHHYFELITAKRSIERMDLDILHGCTGILGYLLNKNRKPTIFQPFGLEAYHGKLLSRVRTYIFAHPFNYYKVRWAEAIASAGEYQTHELMRLFGTSREKIFYLPCGVDIEKIDASIASTQITKEPLGLQDADIVLINVNRLVPNKGVTYLIEALKLLNEVMDARLILVGSGAEERKILLLIQQLGLEDKIIHFKEIGDEMMFQLYTLSDLSVTPTLYEGGHPPLVVLEAMACGKPIVASNIPQMYGAIKEGENGFLVEPANPKAIAEAVLEIYDRELTEKMGRKSKEIVKSYHWEAIARKAISKYEELVG